MDDLYSIDPGLRAAGWAHFHKDVLVDCGCVYADIEAGNGWRQLYGMAKALLDVVDLESMLVVERMEPRKTKTSAFTALIDLSLISGMVAGVHEGPMSFVRPSKWTGQMNKRINHRRIKKRLDDKELDVVAAGLVGVDEDNHKEVLDAIGIGLYELRRLR